MPISLLGSAAVLSRRYSGADHIVLTGRIGNADGAFRLDVDLAGDPSFRELLSSIGRSTDPSDFVGSPSEELAKHVKEFSSSGTATVIMPSDLHRLLSRLLTRLDEPEVGSNDSSAGLTLSLSWADGELQGLFESHNAGGPDKSVIDTLATHFVKLLSEATANPATPISQLNILDDTERRRILYEWNATEHAYSAGCIHEIFETQVAKRPNAVAVRYNTSALTFGELNSRANDVAALLRARGVGPEVLVGVCLKYPLDTVVAIMGVLKAGGAYIPLDLGSASERLKEIIKDAQLTVIVTRPEIASLIPVEDACLQFLDDLPQTAVVGSLPNLHSGATADSAAYVIYTSGSSGKPKGVVGLHRSVTSSLAWAVPIDLGDVYCINEVFTFGSSVLGLFYPLLCGTPLVIIPASRYKDPALLVHALEEEGVTRIGFVPAQLKNILNLGPRISSRLSCLRTVVISGAAATADLVDSFFELLPHARLIHGYSSTEVATMSTRKVVIKETAANPLTIGRPISNTVVYILDQHMNPVPVGVMGELYVGTADMIRGYLNRPELTKAKFVRNPFVEKPGSRLYRTGDIGRYLPNGEIQFGGRGDNQVKIRGMRVELEEIEAVLEGHEGLEGSAVTAQEIRGLRRLVAYVVTKPGWSLSVSALQRYLAQWLPEHMVPSKFVFLDRLPQTPNGKLDRMNLPSPDAVRPDLDSSYEEPRTAVESTLADVWGAVLDVERVGIHDHFIELGGDSMLAVQLARRVSDALGTEASVQLIFEHPTIAELAAELELNGQPSAMDS